jgi:hypothetical protein
MTATKKQPWPPPARADFDKRLSKALTGADNVEYRENLGLQCWTLMDRAWYRRTNAVSARALWNPFRYAAAVIPVIAAGAGGSLVSHVHGTAGTVIGWVALIAGLLGAAINSLRPAVEYGVDLTKAAQFERLYWDILNYAMAKLPIDKPEIVAVALENFAQRMEEIAVISGSTTATGS